MKGGPDEGTFEAVANDGRFRLAAYKKLKLPYESKPYLYIRSSIPLASATSKANAAMFKNLSVFLSMFLIGLLLVWLIGKRVIMKPILLLKKASAELGAGADTVNVSHVVKGGELGELARAFDGMAEGLIQREAALRESEQRWATTLASVGDAVIATDVQGRITFMNAAAEGLTGWTLLDAAKKPVPEVFNIINEHTRNEVESPVTKVLREGTVIGLANHTILIRKDGTEVPIDDSGAPIRDGGGRTMGVVLIFRDITERKQAEGELQKRERLLRDVIDGSSSPIFLKDLDGKFITINASLERMLGMSREAIKGKTDYDIAPEEVADYWSTHDKKVMETGKAIQIEEVADLPDGHHIFLANKFPLVDADGQTYGVGAISNDITDRKQAEEELRKSRDELELRVQERTETLRRQADLLELAHNAILVRDMESRLHSGIGAQRRCTAGQGMRPKARSSITFSKPNSQFPRRHNGYPDANGYVGRGIGTYHQRRPEHYRSQPSCPPAG